MVDSSEGLIKSHKIVNDEQSIQHDPRKQEKMGKIHKDFEDTITNFRNRFAMILSDMKFLVDGEEPRKGIEATGKDLETQENDPIVEENLGEAIDQLNEICTNAPPRKTHESRMASRDPKKKAGSPYTKDEPNTTLSGTKHAYP